MGEPVIDGSWLLVTALAGLGLLVGIYGSLIGVGGALLLVPVLIFIFPEAEPLALTAVSLTIVLVNALGSAGAYAWQRRIDYRSGLWFAAAAIPGVWLGIWTLQFIPRSSFVFIFGAVMILIAGTLAFRSIPSSKNNGVETTPRHRPLGAGLSVGAGYLSGLLGIGGGIIHVPMMTYLLRFKPHIATATSSFILVFTATAGVVTHLTQGNLNGNWAVIPWLAAGVIGGSQIGAHLSKRLQGQALIRILAISLALTGIRLLFG
ncbi:MAG: sulfite exporter TauE/SafE family protein [Dehalogenimonas sp.]